MLIGSATTSSRDACSRSALDNPYRGLRRHQPRGDGAHARHPRRGARAGRRRRTASPVTTRGGNAGPSRGRHRTDGRGRRDGAARARRRGDRLVELPGDALARRAGEGLRADRSQRGSSRPGGPGVANRRTQIDVATFIQWVDAYARGRRELADFYRSASGTSSSRPSRRGSRRSRSEPDAPLTPFAMPQYRLAATAEAERLEAQAAAASEDVKVNIQRADNYVLASSCSRSRSSSPG